MAFLMNHGEKIVAALFAMIGFLALSSANWATTDRSPIALEQTASDNKAKIELNDWPEEDRQWFNEIDDVVEITKEKDGEIVNVADFQIDPFIQDLTAAKEKRTAVSVLAPVDPRAVALIFPLAMPAEEEEVEEEAASDGAGADGGAATDEQKTDDERAAELLAQKFGLRTGAAGGGPGAGGAGVAVAENAGSDYADYAGQMEEMEEMEEDYGGGYGMGEGYGDEMYAQYGAGMMNVEKKNIRVSAGVAATMIIDLQKQRDIVRKALHLTGNYLIAQNEILYVDLVVERRQAGDKGTDWEPVSSADLAEILQESIGFDRDVVSPAVTRSAITMPLPRRAAGVWLPEEVSHPRVEDFVLSPEEKELIDKFNQMVTKRIEEAEEAQPVEITPRGFSGFAQTGTDMQAYGGGGAGGMGEMNYDEMYEDYDDAYGGEQGGSELTADQKQLLDATKATADHRLLLVRFMDFTVERGKSYQYRARVVMKNPNYDHPLEELEDPALAAEPELVSDWSEATNEVFVPTSSRTYLAEVDARAGRQERAIVKVYTDTTETGLSVMGPVKVPVGMPIGGVNAMEVVDLTTDSLEEREVTLKTDELLSAAEELSRLLSSDHPELKPMLDRLDRAAKPIPDQICVVDSSGALKLRSVGDMAAQEFQDQAEYTGILKIYEPWKKKVTNGTAGFFGGEEGDEMMEAGEGYGLGMGAAASSSYKGSGGRRMSSREKARKRRSGELPAANAGGYGGEN